MYSRGHGITHTCQLKFSGLPNRPPTGCKPGATVTKPTYVGFVQLAAPFQGDGGLLGKRGVGDEDKTLSTKRVSR